LPCSRTGTGPDRQPPNENYRARRRSHGSRSRGHPRSGDGAALSREAARLHRAAARLPDDDRGLEDRRDLTLQGIFEGTNEILRLYIGLTGLQKPGDYLKGLGKELANSLTDPIKTFGLLRDYAVRKAKQTVPYGRRQITKAHESMREQVAYVEDSVQALAALCDTALRRHGREVVEMQFATSRIADVAIDLLALCATIARTTRLIEVRGLEKCTNELNMTFAFYSDARHRIRANLRAGTGRNNDEEIKSVADQVLAAGKYENDILK
jgi:acyl-CoA dehydrogenase family protein 9